MHEKECIRNITGLIPSVTMNQNYLGLKKKLKGSFRSFSFPRSVNEEAKHGVEFHHSTRNAWRIGRKVKTGTLGFQVTSA